MERESTTEKSKANGVYAAIAALIFVAGMVLEYTGLRAQNIFMPDIWEVNGWRRFLHYLNLFVLVATPLLIFAPWSFSGIVVVLVSAGTVLATGPVAPLAVIFFLISACALGSRLLGREDDTRVASQALATIVGTAVYIFFMTTLARVPIHYPAVWAVLLGLPIAADLAGTRRRLQNLRRAVLSATLDSWGERIAAALFVFVLGMHWLIALKPEISADGLAMHLAIPANIAAQHRMTFDPSLTIWSMMPMGADWIYSIVYQFGGEMASRLVDFAMLLVLEALLYGAARRWLNRGPALLLAALFATTPMVQLVTGSLFVENVLAALVLALLTALWSLGETGNRRYLFAAAILGGGALTTKFGALAFVVLSLPVAMVEIWRVWRRLSSRPALTCTVALALFAATAAPTYLIAWQKTHNPLYPFLNKKFPGPYLNPKEDVFDTRYHDPVALSFLYDATFRTENYLEARNGAFGFQYLILIPLALAGVLWIRSRPAAGAALVGLAASIAVLKSVSNVRYIYPALPLFTAAFAATLGWASRHSRWLFRALLVSSVAWAALNIYFIPASGWYHRDFYAPEMFGKNGVERYLEHASPERIVIERYNRYHPNSTVLLTNDTNIATIRGRVFENAWHQWNNALAIQRTNNAADLDALFHRWDVGYFIAPVAATGVTTMPPWLRNFLDLCTVTEFELGGYALSHMAECKGDATRTPAAHVDTRPMVEVPPGVYDDFNEAIHYNGDWEQNRTFSGPFQHTITFTDTQDAKLEFAFTGEAITYVFSKTANRGYAEVVIDGTDKGLLDQYAPTTEWQASRRFALSPGKHLISIRVTGQKTIASKGRFVDLDEFIVE